MSRHQFTLCGIIVILLLDRVQSWFVPDTTVFAQTSATKPARGIDDSIVLVDEAGKQLTIRNLDQRISWSNQPGAKCRSMGVFQSGPILTDLLARPEFEKELEPLLEERDTEGAVATAKINDITKRMEGLDRMSPEYRQLYEEYQRIRNEYQQWSDAYVKRLDQVRVGQLRRAYEEMVKSVDVVAEQLEIDIVLVQPRRDAAVSQESYEAAQMDIAFRMVVRFPESIDITDQVRSDLGLRD